MCLREISSAASLNACTIRCWRASSAGIRDVGMERQMAASTLPGAEKMAIPKQDPPKLLSSASVE